MTTLIRYRTGGTTYAEAVTVLSAVGRVLAIPLPSADAQAVRRAWR